MKIKKHKKRTQTKISPQQRKALSEKLRFGFEYHQAGHLDQAEACYREILALVPHDADTNNLLALILHEKRQYAAAAELAGKAVKKEPQRANYLCTLGNALKELGKLDKAIEAYRQTLSLNSTYDEAAFNLADCYYFQAANDKATRVLEEILARKPSFPEVHTHLAIRAWVAGDWSTCEEQYNRLLAAPDQQITNRNFVVPYRTYLGKLLEYRSNRIADYQQQKDIPKLYAIGDSHCLSPAHQAVYVYGNRYRIESRVVVGCKAWHLGNKNLNRFKLLFERIVGSLPDGCVALVLFGQIDCGMNDGIMRAHKKNNTDLTESVQTLVADYMEYVLNHLHPKKIKPIFFGVPPTSQSHGNEADDQLLAKIISEVNKALMENAAKRNVAAVNLQAYALKQQKKSNPDWLIDEIHLAPSVFSDLLSDFATDNSGEI